MFNFALNLFFPPICGLCGKKDDNWLCENCKVQLYKKKKSVIFDVFGKNYEEYGYLFIYNDIRDLILDYKFNEKSYLSNTFSTIILDDPIMCKKIKEYDMIISVPMTKKKKAKRGYNQTELIINNISKKLKIEYNKNILIKIKENKTQSTLKEKDRYKNVKNVYNIKNKELIQNKKIILFDDILTTGATINECSKVLKNNYAKEIFVLTIAKD